VCASNLNQQGIAIRFYATENRNHLPWVVEPVWRPLPSPQRFDYTVDAEEMLPDGSPRHPFAFASVMKPILKNIGTLRCPVAVLGYPETDVKVTYRFAAANASDQKPETDAELRFGRYAYYRYNQKFLNYRKFENYYADENLDNSVFIKGRLVLPLKKGPGPFYMSRDFVNGAIVDGERKPVMPHGKDYNQLRPDLSVALVRPDDYKLFSATQLIDRD
jgi:hypothetical protein